MKRLSSLFAVPTAAALAITALVATPATAADPITIADGAGHRRRDDPARDSRHRRGDRHRLLRVAEQLPRPLSRGGRPGRRRPRGRQRRHLRVLQRGEPRRRRRRPHPGHRDARRVPEPDAAVGDGRRELHGRRGRRRRSRPPSRSPTRVLGSAREAFEGMLVQPSGDYVLSSTHELFNFGSLWLSAGQEAVTPTEAADAGSADAIAIAADNAARRILIDDGYSIRVDAAAACRRAAVLHEEHRRAPRRHPGAAGARRWCSGTGSTSGGCSRRCR